MHAAMRPLHRQSSASPQTSPYVLGDWSYIRLLDRFRQACENGRLLFFLLFFR